MGSGASAGASPVEAPLVAGSSAFVASASARPGRDLASPGAEMAAAMAACWRFAAPASCAMGDEPIHTPGIVPTSRLLEERALESSAFKASVSSTMGDMLSILAAHFRVDFATVLVAMTACVSETLMGRAGVARENPASPVWLQHLPTEVAVKARDAGMAAELPAGAAGSQFKLSQPRLLSRGDIMLARREDPTMFRDLPAAHRVELVAALVADPVATDGQDFELVHTLNLARVRAVEQYSNVMASYADDLEGAISASPTPGCAVHCKPAGIKQLTDSTVVSWQRGLRTALRDGDMVFTKTLHVVAEYVSCRNTRHMQCARALCILLGLGL